MNQILIDPDIALGRRLARIWDAVEYETSYDLWQQWVFRADLPQNARLHAQHSSRETQLFMRFDVEGLRLSWTIRERIYIGTYEPIKNHEALAAQWLPTFRRNCWASGAALECSAHERLEWAKELKLTEEEVKQWALKL